MFRAVRAEQLPKIVLSAGSSLQPRKYSPLIRARYSTYGAPIRYYLGIAMFLPQVNGPLFLFTLYTHRLLYMHPHYQREPRGVPRTLTGGRQPQLDHGGEAETC